MAKVKAPFLWLEDRLAAAMPARARAFSHEQKLLIGITLGTLAFVPALAISAYSVVGVAESSQRLFEAYSREAMLARNLLIVRERQVGIMPIFAMSGERRILDEFDRLGADFDRTLAETASLEPEGSEAARILERVRLASDELRAKERPRIEARLAPGGSDYAGRQLASHGEAVAAITRDLERFTGLVTDRYADHLRESRTALATVRDALMVAVAFALLVCFAVAVSARRVLRSKRQVDIALARQADFDRRVSEARKEAVETVAHDLRSPLQAIAIAGTMLRDARGDANVSAAAAEIVESSTRAMRRLVEGVLDTARLDGGAMPLERKEVQLAEVLGDVARRFAVLAGAKGVNLHHSTEADLPPLFADPVRLDQLTSNLLANALKFTDPGGTVRLTGTSQGFALAIEVSDTGRGMEPEQAERVFERYWKGGGGEEHGAGLGLTIARSVAEAHGGTIRVASRPGLGTTFTALLPLRARADAEGGSADRPRREQRAAPPKPNGPWWKDGRPV